MELMPAVQMTAVEVKLSIWGGKSSEVCRNRCNLLTCAPSKYTERKYIFKRQEMSLR